MLTEFLPFLTAPKRAVSYDEAYLDRLVTEPENEEERRKARNSGAATRQYRPPRFRRISLARDGSR